MALDPNDTVDVMHPQTGQVITLPTSVAQMAGVTPDMVVPRSSSPDQQVTAIEYPMTQIGATVATIPPSPPPPPPPPPPNQIGAAPGSPQTPAFGEVAASGNDTGMPGQGIIAPTPSAPAGQGPFDTANPASAPAGQGGVPSFTPDQLNAVKPGAQAATQDTTPQVTTQGLRSMGIAGATNLDTTAINDAAKAGQVVADKQAQQQLTFAQAYDDRNQQIDKLVADRAKAATDASQAVAARTNDYNQAVQQYGNTKIDASLDHPILSTIAVALSGLGAAMVKSTDNPALKALNDAIARKVQVQIANKQNLATAIGMKHDAVDMARQKATDVTAQYNLAIGAESEKAARQVEAITARSNSDIVRANGAQVAAQLRQKGAEAIGNAAIQQQGKDERDQQFAAQQKHLSIQEKQAQQQIGIAGGHLALAGKQFAQQQYEFETNRKDKLDEFAMNKLLAGDAKSAALAKQVQTLGVGDPTTGNTLLQPEGQKIIDHAKQLEQAASVQTDPTKKQSLIDQANYLRQQAEVGIDAQGRPTAFLAASPEEQAKISDKVASSQQLANSLGKVNALIASDPGMTNRDAWQQAKTQVLDAKIKYIAANAKDGGATISSRSLDALDGMFPDATSVWGRTANTGKLSAAIDTALGDVTTDTRVYLRAKKYRGDWSPAPPTSAPEPKLEGKTSLEASQDATPSTAATALYYPLSGSAGRAKIRGDVASGVEETAPQGPTGLSPNDTGIVTQQAKKYDNPKTSDEDKAKIRTQLTQYIGSSRPGFAQGVAQLLKGTSESAYNDVVASNPNAPADPGAAVQASLVQQTDLGTLQQQASVGDLPAAAELYRRAQAGDRAAGRAYLNALTAKTSAPGSAGAR